MSTRLHFCKQSVRPLIAGAEHPEAMQTGSCGKSQSYYVLISLIILIAACNFIREQIFLSSTSTLPSLSVAAQQRPFTESNKTRARRRRSTATIMAKTDDNGKSVKLSPLNISNSEEIFASSSFFVTAMTANLAPPPTASHKTPVMENALTKSWLEVNCCCSGEHEFNNGKSASACHSLLLVECVQLQQRWTSSAKWGNARVVVVVVTVIHE